MSLLLDDEPKIKGKVAQEEAEILAGIVEATRLWTAAAKERALNEYRARISADRKVWYCLDPNRSCDGQPHGRYNYPHARADQWPPEMQFFVWALVGGRGSGKTRSGAEYIRKMSEKTPRIALVAPTSADVRDTMILGESGLQAVFAHSGKEILWQPSKRLVTFPNGAQAKAYSGEEPERLRGPQHGCAWLDEPAHIPAIEDVWSNLLLGLRLGKAPTIAVTTTPRPTKWMKELLKDPTTVSSRVSTYANLSNLADTFAATVLKKYEGTRLGRQELHGEILEDVEGALWNNEMILYVDDDITVADMERIVVAVDPAGSQGQKSDETGIIVVGKIGQRAYVIADYTGKYSPNGWAKKVIKAYKDFQADAIVAEKNYGGEMVESNIRNELKLQLEEARILVKTATRGKKLRAEPVVGLYEQKRVQHFHGLAKLEEEQLQWIPGEGHSPNRVDALVWGVDELIKPDAELKIATPKGRDTSRGRGLTSSLGSRTGLPSNFPMRRRAS